LSVQAQANSTSVEPGSTITVPFTVATTTNGVINDTVSRTFAIRANNDRSYDSTSPSSVSIAAGSGGKANGTVTVAVPSNATSGTVVTLTVEAENSDPADADINYTVLRFSVAAKVTDVTRPLCQVVSTSGICPASSSLCASSQWNFSANLTDGINGTSIESVTIRRGNGTLNTSTAIGAGGENVTVVTYSASCCSQTVELTAVDGVGNVGTCVGQARVESATTVLATTAGNTMTSRGRTVAVSDCLWISLLVFYLWK
ncbi:hypothetical protein LDENG_00153160, partial [Lucifuga dentata]